MMNKYFYQLDIPILKDHEKDDLIELALLHNAHFKPYVSALGIADENQTWRSTALYERSFVKRLKNNCNLSCIPVLLRHQPGAEVFKHVDDPNRRNSVLSIPLTPKIDYPPTYFFRSHIDIDPIAVAEFPNLNACLLNTQKVHSLINNSNGLRINFQLAFNEPFEQVREMIMNNTLFKIEL